MIEYTQEFLASLGLTICLEIICLFLIIRKKFLIDKSELSNEKIAFLGGFASLATLPYVWFIFPFIFYKSYTLALILSEIFVFTIEMFFYWATLKISFKKAFWLSVIANSASLLLGMLALNSAG